MKMTPSIRFRSLFAGAGILATVFASGPVAGAQPSAQRATMSTSTSTTTTTTSYTEQSVGGDQVVTFTGDELAAPPNGFFDGAIRPVPGAVRVGLIRPRMNFVSELLKSVENL